MALSPSVQYASNRRSKTADERLVEEYFKRISESPSKTLELFTDDAIIYEPFSGDKALRGKDEIAYFLKVARMANQDLEKEITFADLDKNPEEIEAIVRFTKGSSVIGKFQFKTEDVLMRNSKGRRQKKIKELRIQFQR